MHLLHDRLAEMLGSAVIGSALADQRRDQASGVKGLETLRALIEMLPKEPAFLLAQTLME
jgi:hypothetical protein